MDVTGGEERSAPEAQTGPGESQHAGFEWSRLLTGTLLVVVLLIMAWLAFNVRIPSVDELRAGLSAWGGWAWAAFVILYLLVAITPIPVTIMATAAGVLFGVSQRDFLVGSIAGTVPGQVSLVAIGAFVAKPELATGVVVAVAWVAVIVMAIHAYRSVRKSSPKYRAREGT